VKCKLYETNRDALLDEHIVAFGNFPTDNIEKRQIDADLKHLAYQYNARGRPLEVRNEHGMPIRYLEDPEVGRSVGVRGMGGIHPRSILCGKP
jgi:hypothetical protein